VEKGILTFAAKLPEMAKNKYLILGDVVLVTDDTSKHSMCPITIVERC